MASAPQLESGNVGEDTVRSKPLAPRGTGSDGSRLHRRGNIPPSANEAPRWARVSLFRPRSTVVIAVAAATRGSNASPACALGTPAVKFGRERGSLCAENLVSEGLLERRIEPCAFRR